MNTKLLELTEQVLGKGKVTNKGNVAFHCPFCHSSKKKFEVQMITDDQGNNRSHCWVCNKAFLKLPTLFKSLNVSRHILANLYSILNVSSNYTNSQSVVKRAELEHIALPKEYIPLYQVRDSTEYKNAIHYLRNKRNITFSEIVKYQIGYCETGEYSKRIIVPSYDQSGQLNYFTGRAYYESESFRHKNPDFSKNIILMELFINWSLPIIICEGMFDAIAIRRNAIPLLGKTIPEKLKLKIVTEKVKDIYIALDKDAQIQALQHAEYFINNGCNVYLVNLHEKDPAEIGFENMTKLIKQARKISDLDLITMKLML